MVTVPVSRQRVAVQPLAPVRQQIAVSPETFGAGQARALEQGGRQLQQAGAQIGAAALDGQRRQNETATRQAIADWQKRTTPLLTEFQAQRGKNAVDTYSSIKPQLDVVTADIRANLPSDKAREMFDLAVTQRRATFEAATRRHYGREFQVYELGALGAQFEAAVEQGIAAPETIPDQIRLIQAATRDIQDLTGEADEAAAGRVRTAVTAMHAGVIDRLLADGGSRVAAAHYEAHQEQMLPSERARIERRIDAVREAEIRVAQAELGRQVDEALWLMSRGFRPQNLANLRASALGTAYGEVLDQATAALDEREGFAMLPARERALRLAELQPSPQGAGRLEVEQHTALTQLDENLRRLATDDAMLTAHRQGIVAPKPLSIQTPNASELASRVEQARLVSAHYGVQASPLTEAEAVQLRQYLTTAGPAGQIAMLNWMRDGAGESYAPLLRQIAEDDGAGRFWAVAGGIAQTNPEAARKVILGQDVIAASQGVLPSRGEINGWVLTRLEGLFVGRPRAQLDALNAIESLYASLLAERGELDQTSAASIDRGLMQQSIEGVLGPVVEFNGHQILPPSRSYDEDSFEEQMDSLTDADLGAAVGLDGSRFTAEQIRDDGQLITVSPGVYRVRIAGLDLLDEAGSPFILRLPVRSFEALR